MPDKTFPNGLSLSNRLQIHYYFRDESHSMNAKVRNECEREILSIFKELIASLDFDIEIESEALTEGGLKDLWKLLGENSAQITLILAILTVMLSRVPVENKELIGLQIENLKYDNELKKEELKKVRVEIENKDKIAEEIVERVIRSLEDNYKLSWHKSSYYKRLSNYPKVDKISAQTLDNESRPTSEEKEVRKSEFPKFIFRSDKLLPITDDDAVIDIISPVLTSGRFNWRGVYNGSTISFEMADKDFKSAVLDRSIEFVNGMAIRCVLVQNRRIDENGLVQTVSFRVMTVIEIIERDRIVETKQGTKFKEEKEFQSRQLNLF